MKFLTGFIINVNNLLGVKIGKSKMEMKRAESVARIYKELQRKMCLQLNEGDGKGIFNEFPWRKDIGRGLTCVMQNGAVIEKAGLNFSHVIGPFKPEMKASLQVETAESYSATGISSIIHPNNPHIPIIHMNVRFFELNNGICWFGGGIDLTPHYIDKKEAQWFHKKLSYICNKYDTSFYDSFKKWADDYFYLSHRDETRGIGGIFFDRIQPKDDTDFEKILHFTMDLANVYPEIYCTIMNEKRNTSFSEQEKIWQNIRRGRYVEFNLVHDRGTKFGLESNGNIESILVSMPPVAEWQYNLSPKKNSKEEQTVKLLRKNIDWINAIESL